MQDQPLPAESVLAKYTHDLTALARQGRFAPLLHREKEVERVLQILARRIKNNPMLIGEDSAERFAVVAEVIRRISIGDVPEGTKVQRVVALDLEKLSATSQTPGDFEKLLRAIVAEVAQSEGQTLLFIDNMQTLLSGGWTNGTDDAAKVVMIALARGEIVVMGTSTLDDYRKYIERDAALQRRFQEIVVREMAK